MCAGCGALASETGTGEPVLASEAVHGSAAPATDPAGTGPAGTADGTTDPGSEPAAGTGTDPGATGGGNGANPTMEPAPGSSDPDPELSPDPDIVYPAGTCYRQPIAGQPAIETPCEEPHSIEVYASVDLPGAPGSPYLGLDAALDVCGTEFERITGIGIGLATVFDRSVLRPSEATWAEGERTVTCYVVHPVLVTERLDAIDPLRSFGRVSLFGLVAGDCLVAFDDTSTWFELSPCDRPHEAEVFLAHRFPNGPYPGDAVVDATADELCFGSSFEDFVGRDYATSTVLSLTSVPTADSWEQGDRILNCILVDGLVRSSSFRDSGL